MLVTTCIIWFITYEYEQGILANIEVTESIRSQFNYPDTGLLGIIVSIYNLGCFTGCLIKMYLRRVMRKKRCIWLGLLFIIIGAMVQTCSYTVAQLFVERFLIGIGT